MFNVKWQDVTPREADPSICLPAEPVIRANKSFDYNASHLIAIPDLSLIADTGISESICATPVHIFLAGTGSAPTFHHPARHWLRRSASLGYPSIALSYQWANLTDMEKNARAAHSSDDPDEQQRWLADYHKCVVFGGTQPDVHSVHASSSVHGRITSLIKYLAANTTGLQGRLWQSLLDPNASSRGDRGYDSSRVVISGHSQGAGHACYYAKYQPFRRAILLSGPQDFLSETAGGMSSWLRSATESSNGDHFATLDLKAFMHAAEEGTAELIRTNWQFIQPLHCDHDMALVIEQVAESILFPDFEAITSRQKSASHSRSTCNCFSSEVAPDRDRWLHMLQLENPSLAVGLTSEAAIEAMFRQSRPCHNSTVGDTFTPMLPLLPVPRQANGDTTTGIFYGDADETPRGQPLYFDGIWRQLLLFHDHDGQAEAVTYSRHQSCL